MRKLLILLGLTVCLSGCAVLKPFAALDSLGESRPRRMHVKQRGPCDCAVAVLAMVTRTMYEVANTAVPPALLEGDPCGITTNQFVSIAASMGRRLRFIEGDEGFDPRRDVGAVVVELPNGLYHMVFIAHGIVYDPAREWPMKWDDYREFADYRIQFFIYEVGHFEPRGRR